MWYFYSLSYFTADFTAVLTSRTSDMEEGTSKKTYLCTNCQKKYNRKLSLCSRCKTVAYCSSKCQKEDWKKAHKLVCKTLASVAKTNTPEGQLFTELRNGRIRKKEAKLLRGSKQAFYREGTIARRKQEEASVGEKICGGGGEGPSTFAALCKGKKGKKMVDRLRKILEKQADASVVFDGGWELYVFSFMYFWALPYLAKKEWKSVLKELSCYPYFFKKKMNHFLEGASLLDVAREYDHSKYEVQENMWIDLLLTEYDHPPHLLESKNGMRLLEYYSRCGGNLHRHQGYSGYSPIHFCAKHNIMEPLCFLLAEGVSVNLPLARSTVTNMGSASTPLILAGMYHSAEAFVEMCKSPLVNFEIYNTSGLKALHKIINPISPENMARHPEVYQKVCSDQDIENMLEAYIANGGDPESPSVAMKSGMDAATIQMGKDGANAADMCTGEKMILLKWVARKRVCPVTDYSSGSKKLRMVYAYCLEKKLDYFDSQAGFLKFLKAMKSGEVDAAFSSDSFSFPEDLFLQTRGIRAQMREMSGSGWGGVGGGGGGQNPGCPTQ